MRTQVKEKKKHGKSLPIGCLPIIYVTVAIPCCFYVHALRFGISEGFGLFSLILQVIITFVFLAIVLLLVSHVQARYLSKVSKRVLSIVGIISGLGSAFAFVKAIEISRLMMRIQAGLETPPPAINEYQVPEAQQLYSLWIGGALIGFATLMLGLAHLSKPKFTIEEQNYTNN